MCEVVLDDPKSGPASAALMGLNMLIEPNGGRNYPHQESSPG